MLELVGGTLLWSSGRPRCIVWACVLARHELADEPDDWVVMTLRHLAESFSVETRHFASAYLIGHGVLKIFLAVTLLRERPVGIPDRAVSAGDIRRVPIAPVRPNALDRSARADGGGPCGDGPDLAQYRSRLENVLVATARRKQSVRAERHWITSSARGRRACGIVTPRARAVFARLSTSSYPFATARGPLDRADA